MDNKDEKYNADEIIEVADSDISDATAEDINEYLDPMSVFDELDITRKTASLWQYKPVPEDEPEPFEEYYFSEEDFEGGKITAARVRGKKHKHDGTNCDDWFEYDVSGNWRIMIVSDGAGSKKFSRIGAREACRAGVSYLKEKLTEAPEEITSNLSLDFADGKFTESCSYFASVLQDAVISAKDSVEKAFEERKSKYDYLSILGRDLELKDF